jgi:hypothetical protein
LSQVIGTLAVAAWLLTPRPRAIWSSSLRQSGSISTSSARAMMSPRSASCNAGKTAQRADWIAFRGGCSMSDNTS